MELVLLVLLLLLLLWLEEQAEGSASGLVAWPKAQARQPGTKKRKYQGSKVKGSVYSIPYRRCPNTRRNPTRNCE